MVYKNENFALIFFKRLIIIKVKLMKKIIIIISILFLSISSVVIYKFKMPKTILKEEEKIDEIASQIENMSLEEKIGQLLIISIKENSMNPELEERLAKIKPGGIILFKDNITNYQNTLKLINDLKDNSEIPLFISTDQEGGRVQRISSLGDLTFTTIPSMEKLGSYNDFNLTYEVGKVIGEELRLLGINLDFAPVVDVVRDQNFIGDRSFGSNPFLVGLHGLSLAKGLNAAGVISCFKHFPNHGFTITDSHQALPILKETKEELLNTGFLPYKMAIEENIADLIMIGHLSLPNITSDNTPASLSKVLITDILKNELGYQGLVITDALNMEAITNNYQEKEIYEKALNAGVDILLMPLSDNVIDIIKDLVLEKKVSIDKINESVKKILLLKKTKLSENSLPLSSVDFQKHQEIIEKLS